MVDFRLEKAFSFQRSALSRLIDDFRWSIFDWKGQSAFSSQPELSSC